MKKSLTQLCEREGASGGRGSAREGASEMLDEFVVFSKGGLVLFRWSTIKVKGDPVGALIRTVLLENRMASEKAFKQGSYALKHVVVNEHDLVFAAVYQAMLKPPYVDQLLASVSKAFCKTFKDEIRDACGHLDFDKKFDKLLWEAEESSRRPKKPQAHQKKKGASDPASGPQDDEEEENTDKEAGESDEVQKMMESLQKRQARKGRPGAYVPKDKKGGGQQPSPTRKKGKEKRTWGEGNGALTEEEAAKLDMSDKTVSEDKLQEIQEQQAKKYLPESGDEKADLDRSDSEDDEAEVWTFGKSSVGQFFARMAGQKPLTREELAPAIDNLEKQLQSNNVSASAARDIAEAVSKDLEGKTLGSFTRGMSQAVRESCHSALQRLLTPKRSVDILREARAAKAAGRPYVIVFIGVNGVGKTTSNGKLCYYLKQNGLKVLMTACDTFRSGAVEQLKVHSRNLGVEVFEQGYNKDASLVAANGIKHAKENGFDVVTIDTAGRMQNNEPLMRALTKLVARNQPDLVLFVGEALVGNDGRDQLVLFDNALVDYSDSPNPRRIDAIILTKYDTIGDKVGATVSMVHSTGQPIMFVGTGQKYTNLNRLNISKVLKALLSS